MKIVWVAGLIAIFALTVAERLLAAFHRCSNSSANVGAVDRTRAVDHAFAIAGQIHVDHKLRRAIDDDVGVMACEDDLPPLLGLMELFRNCRITLLSRSPSG